ncbi:MAG: hypothetical protein AAB428_00435, partial [Patescibacteria group bacterium]
YELSTPFLVTVLMSWNGCLTKDNKFAKIDHSWGWSRRTPKGAMQANTSDSLELSANVSRFTDEDNRGISLASVREMK